MAFKNIEDRKQYMRDYYANKRAEYIKLLGGKCVECGSTSNLEFDHKDVTKKNFNIGKLMTFSKVDILEELKLCQILCETCHEQKSIFDRKIHVKLGSFAKGSEVHGSKFTEKDVRNIKEHLKNKTMGVMQLARLYKVNQGSISNIKSGKTWKHLEG